MVTFFKAIQESGAETMFKRRILRAALLMVLCLTMMMCHSLVVNAAAKVSGYDAVDEYVHTCVQKAHIPALSITIVDKDKVLFSGHYGECDSCDTPFLLGSVSKSFTAVCIMQLVEKGQLDLDAAISSYLPDAVNGDSIKVRQLLNHTSGLGEHQALNNYHIINEQGTHHYANVNYSLLGKIIEKVSGMPYEAYIRKNVFTPLGLTHTAATLTESMDNGLIDGYTDFAGFHIQRPHRYPTSENDWITVPAGNISSCANDLGKYLQMYLNDGQEILSKQSVDTMFYKDTVMAMDDDIPFWYGYGWATIKEPLPEPVLRHSGLVETGTACIFILPERDIGIAVTTNVNDYFVTNEMMDRLGWGIVLMLLGEQPNAIADNEYLLAHLRIDLIELVVWGIALLSLCLLPRYKKALQKKAAWYRVMMTVCLHLLLPLLILLFVPIVYHTPLWVAEAFVPDIFVTAVLSSSLLFAGGIVKAIWLIRNALHQRTKEQTG